VVLVVLRDLGLNMERVARVDLPEHLDDPVDKSDTVTVTRTMGTMAQQDILEKSKYNNLQWRYHDLDYDLGFDGVAGV
jgi:hypothetical protein